MKEKTIIMDDSWDIIVVGGGPAGCTSAAAAAREGARTLLVEATGCLGGMGTSGLVPSWCPFSDKEKVIYKGMAEKVFNEAKKVISHVKQDAVDWVPIDPEHLKMIYDDLVIESGATVLFNTALSLVETDDQGSVEAIIVSNKAGLTALKAKVYIDCTGDADLSAWAGAEFYKGSEQTGELQPATHCFILSNVDTYAYVNGPVLHPRNPDSPIYDIVRSGKYPQIPDVHLCSSLIGPSTVGFNAGHIWNVDNTDSYNTSKGLMCGRKLASAIKDSLAEYHPKAFANSFLVATGSLIGIRETRRIIGDYYLTIEDYNARSSFEDEICRNSYPIDIHTAKNEVEQANRGELDVMDRFESFKKGESHGVPYRCLTPKGLKNVLVAGRAISCDRFVQGSVRVMPVCLAMGEAAGIAGALAGKMDTPDVHRIDIKVLKTRLKEEGAYLPE
jgi:hypothetical protein